MKLGLVLIDTYPKQNFLRWIVAHCCEHINFSEIYIFSEERFFEHGCWYKIPPLRSIADYSEYVLKVLPMIVSTDQVMIIQWDGYIISGDRWNEEFLGYDYIGAPWEGHEVRYAVGNGGFSLRSRRLLNEIRNQPILVDFSIGPMAEDVRICKTFRSLLEHNSIKFAPVDIASRFSFEWGTYSGSPLGFHGPRNIARFTAEKFLIEFCEDILLRVTHPGTLVNFVNDLGQYGKHDAMKFYITSINNNLSLLHKIRTYLGSLKSDHG